MNYLSPPLLIATWFGSGLIPKAPGTWGSLASVPFGVALHYFFGIYGLLIAIALIAVIGTLCAHEFESQAHTHDDKRIVVDETLGQWIALLPLSYTHNWSILAAFVLFRIFDVLKPWPISYIDKHIPGAIGVMLDDALAGLIAGFILLGVLTYV